MANTDALLHDLLVRIAPNSSWLQGLLGDDSTLQPLIKGLPGVEMNLREYARQVVDSIRRRWLEEHLLSLLQRTCPDEQAAINDVRRSLEHPMHIEEIVRNDALMDNWAHKEIAILLAQGPTDEAIAGIDVRPDVLVWTDEPRLGIALESLLSLLSTIVLHDRILVDQSFRQAWARIRSPLLGLEAGEILTTFSEPSGLSEIKRTLYRDLFAANSLNTAHRMLISIYRETGKPPGDYASQVLWGAVGGLARSAALDVAYTAHPIRQRLLEQTPFASQRADATILLLDQLDQVQAQRIATLATSEVLDIRALLPPLIRMIVRAAKTPEGLILAALQVREEFADLRHDILARTVLSLPGLHQRAALLLQKIFVTKADNDVLDKLLRLFDALHPFAGYGSMS